MKIKNVFAFMEACSHNSALRSRALMGILLVGLYLLIIPDLLWKQSLEKDFSRLTDKYLEFSTLTREYQSLKERVLTVEKKKALTEASGIARIIGEISQSLGMKGKVKSVKETGTRKTLDRMREETSEVQMEKVNMTELLHLLYKVENAPMILAVKKVAIKKSFENPALLDVTMSVSLFTAENIL